MVHNCEACPHQMFHHQPISDCFAYLLWKVKDLLEAVDRRAGPSNALPVQFICRIEVAFKGLENPTTLSTLAYRRRLRIPQPPNLGMIDLWKTVKDWGRKTWQDDKTRQAVWWACCSILLFSVIRTKHRFIVRQNTVFPFVAWPPKAKRPTACHKIAEAKWCKVYIMSWPHCSISHYALRKRG